MEITAKPTRPKCHKFKSQSGTDTPHLKTVSEKEKTSRVRVKPDGTLRKPLQTLTLRGQKSGKPLQNSGYIPIDTGGKNFLFVTAIPEYVWNDWMKKGLPYRKLNGRVYFKKEEVMDAMNTFNLRKKNMMDSK